MCTVRRSQNYRSFKVLVMGVNNTYRKLTVPTRPLTEVNTVTTPGAISKDFVTSS